MTTQYSISINDWQDGHWNFKGREVAEAKFGEWSEDNQKGISEDDFYPMMNYAYPLYSCPSDEEILKIQDKTCLTIVENDDTGDFFLALCGGGMDLSQDVGMAYMLAGERIPTALALEICTQPNLSQHGINFRRLMKACKDVMNTEIKSCEYAKKRFAEAIKQSLEMDRQKVTHVSELKKK